MKTIVITLDEFKKVLDERLELVLSRLMQKQEHSKSESLITRKDVARLFGVSLVTINAWMKEGILPFHRINSRVYFKKSEVLASLETVSKHRKKK